MRVLLSRIATLLIMAETGAGCGNSVVPTTSVLTTVEVTPATATLFTVAPGNTATLSVVGKDQDGQTMAAGSPSFSSDNEAIASVGANGTVTALAPGTAHITASLTAGSITKTAPATITAQVAPANVRVDAAATGFQPPTVDVQAGGTVTWTFNSSVHTVTFTTPGAPANIDQQGGSVSRTFPNNGIFHYQCSMPSMSGVVRVH